MGFGGSSSLAALGVISLLLIGSVSFCYMRSRSNTSGGRCYVLVRLCTETASLTLCS